MLMAGRNSLAQRFDPRSNSLWTMRLVLATVVAVVHVRQLGWNTQPSLGQTPVGEIAVDGFFVISGFLVTRSAVRLRNLRRFAWHRALRIMPGFWVCLVITGFVTAPVVAALRGRPATSVLTGPDSAAGFVLNNAALLIRQWEITGLPGPLRADSMNGSLWTLFYEAVCYLGVGTLLALGLLAGPSSKASRLRKHALIGITVAVWAALLIEVVGLHREGLDILPRLGLMFLFGALGHQYAHRIRFSPALLALAGATLVVALAGFGEYRLLGGAAFAYLVLWAMVALPLRRELSVDLSYGMYVYHWPVILVLVEAGGSSLGGPLLTILSLTITGLLALVSWRLIEAPALSQKNAAWIERPLPRVRVSGRRG